MIFTGMSHTDWILLAFLAVYIAFKFLYLFWPHTQNSLDFSFILHAHWGDCIGIWLILLGVIIALTVPWLYHGNETVMVSITRTGDGLIAAGIMALKLKTVPGPAPAEDMTQTTTATTSSSSTVTPPKVVEEPAILTPPAS
jgi:hypothetical protein